MADHGSWIFRREFVGFSNVFFLYSHFSLFLRARIRLINSESEPLVKKSPRKNAKLWNFSGLSERFIYIKKIFFNEKTTFLCIFFSIFLEHPKNDEMIDHYSKIYRLNSYFITQGKKKKKSVRFFSKNDKVIQYLKR